MKSLRPLLLLVVVPLVFCFDLADAHESCCKKHLHKHADHDHDHDHHHHHHHHHHHDHDHDAISEFIDDPHDDPPLEYQGQSRWIPDPNEVKPELWDDEDDGPWEPSMIAIPEYNWKPRLIPNPHYSAPPAPPTYWEVLRGEVKRAMPWVTLGVLITSLLSAIPLPVDKLGLSLRHKSHSGGGGLLGSVKAAVIGLATPLCSCGALPMASGLISHGVPLTAAMTFLTASQSAGLDSAAMTYGLLGPQAVLWRLGGALLLAVAAGLACPRSGELTRKTNGSSSNGVSNGVSSNGAASNGTSSHGASSNGASSSCCGSKNDAHGSTANACKKGKANSIKTFLLTLIDTTTEIFPTVLAGLALSTAALHFLPSLFDLYNQDSNDKDDSHSFVVRLTVLLSTIPLQLCEHTTVTLAATLSKASSYNGLAFAFLLSAPAVNMPTLLLLLQHGGVGAVMRMVVALSTVAVFLSYAVERIGVHVMVDQAELAGGMMDLPRWYVEGSRWVGGGLFCVGVLRSVLSTRVSVVTSKKKIE